MRLDLALDDVAAYSRRQGLHRWRLPCGMVGDQQQPIPIADRKIAGPSRGTEVRPHISNRGGCRVRADTQAGCDLVKRAVSSFVSPLALTTPAMIPLRSALRLTQLPSLGLGRFAAHACAPSAAVLARATQRRHNSTSGVFNTSRLVGKTGETESESSDADIKC